MQLTKKQKEIISLMRNGLIIRVSLREGNKVNKYFMGNSIHPVRRRPIVDLYDEKLLQFNQLNYSNATFTLTELGKTIDIN